MTIINQTLNSERGSVAVEATFVLMFFSGIFIYAFQQAFVMTLKYSVEKTSAQAASLVSQRSVLFENKNLQLKDMDLLRRFIPAISDPKNDFYDVHVEEVAYQSGAYNAIYMPSNDGVQCSLNTKLSAYNFNVQTSFAKKNSMYRVTVCRRVKNMFYSSGELIISSSTVMPGHHH